jgi:hypothetical protein
MPESYPVEFRVRAVALVRAENRYGLWRPNSGSVNPVCIGGWAKIG